jgi:hypothetical protein
MFNIKTSNGTVWMNNFKSRITHRGNLRIKLRVDTTDGIARYQYLTLRNVAYVPTSSHNLFSVTAFLDDSKRYDRFSAKVVYLANKSILTLPSGDTYTGTRAGNLYLMEWPEEEESVQLHTNAHATPPKSYKKPRGAKVKKQLDIDVQQETSDSKLQSSDSELDTSDSTLPKLQSSDSELDTSDSKFQSSDSELQSSGSDSDSNTA